MRLAIVGCALALSACSHPSAAQRPDTQASRRAAAHAADPLAFLPADSEVVVAVDFAQLRSSAVWRRWEPKVRVRIGGDLERFRTLCGIDPLTQMRSVTIGLRGLDQPHASGTMVLRGLDRDPLLKCVERNIPNELRLSMADGVVTIQPADKDGYPLAFTFADPTTLVVITSPTASPKELADVLARGAPLRRSPGFVALQAQVDTHDALWFVMSGKHGMFDQLAKLGVDPNAFVGSVSMANGLSADLRLRLDSPEQAAGIATMMREQLAKDETFAHSLKVSSENADIVGHLVLTEEQLDTFTQTAVR